MNTPAVTAKQSSYIRRLATDAGYADPSAAARKHSCYGPKRQTITHDGMLGRLTKFDASRLIDSLLAEIDEQDD